MDVATVDGEHGLEAVGNFCVETERPFQEIVDAVLIGIHVRADGFQVSQAGPGDGLPIGEIGLIGGDVDGNAPGNLGIRIGGCQLEDVGAGLAERD